MTTSVYPEYEDAFVNPTATDPTTDPDHAGQHTHINDAVAAIQSFLGTLASLNVILAENGIATGPLNFTVGPDTAEYGGIRIQFTSGSASDGISVTDHTGLEIGGIGNTGGLKIFGDMVQAAHGYFGPFIGFNGQTNPPSLLWPSGTNYGAGCQFWSGAGLPTDPTYGILAGTAKVNDQWYDSVSGNWYICTVSGTPGTWIQDTSSVSGVGSYNGRTGAVVPEASDIYGLFTQLGQILWGTGNGTGQIIHIIDALNFSFAEAGQLLMGSGLNTGVLLSPGPAGYVLTSAGASEELVWTAVTGTGNMNTSTYDPAGIAQQVVGLTATQTLTNKTITPRVLTVNNPSSTPSFAPISYDTVNYTGVASGITISATGANPSTGYTFLMYISDNGTAQSLAYGSSFVDSAGVTRPTETPGSGHRMYIEWAWNEVSSKYECIGHNP